MATTNCDREGPDRRAHAHIGARNRGRGVTVNAVAPGAIDTPFYHGPESPEAVAYVTNAVPAKRLGMISDIVPLVAFLASARAQWVSGQTLWINGAYDTR